MIQDPIFYIHVNPHMSKYEPVPPLPEAVPIPEDRQVTGIGEPQYYKVTDRVHTLPAGLLDSDVVSTYEFIKLEKGVFVRIRSPLSTIMESVWQVQENEDGTAELVEEIQIKTSRLLMGTIKGMCESGWKGIHETILKGWSEGP